MRSRVQQVGLLQPRSNLLVATLEVPHEYKWPEDLVLLEPPHNHQFHLGHRISFHEPPVAAPVPVQVLDSHPPLASLTSALPLLVVLAVFVVVDQQVETSRGEPLDCQLIPLEPQWVWRPMVSVAQAAATSTWELPLLVLNPGTEVPHLRILLEVVFPSVGQEAQLQLPEVAEPRVEV